MMILYEDTRNKIGRHKNVHDYCEKHGIEIVRQCLNVGDYMLSPGGKISIDTKSNLDELSRNLLNRSDHARFWKEVRRAREQGIKLIVLCEHGGKVKTLQDVAQWRSKYSGISGRAVLSEIYRVHISYGVEFVFCSKRSTGKKIVELLQNSIS